MRPAHIEVIVAIAEAGSLRAAAEILGKTQPALTKALKIAEDDLGARIFVRAARGVEPTEIGMTIIARARIIQAELQTLDEEVQQIQGLGVGTLHVTVSPLAAVRIVPQVMDRFRHKYPGVRVHIAGGHPPSTMGALRSGDTDIVIGPEPSQDTRTGLQVHHLFSSPLSVITGVGSRYADKRHLADLLDADWVMIGPRERSFGVGQDFAALGLVPPTPSIASDSITSLLMMIEDSERLSSFPTLFLSEIERRWQVQRLPLVDRLNPVEIGLMTRANRPLTPAGRSFAEMAIEQGQKIGTSA